MSLPGRAVKWGFITSPSLLAEIEYIRTVCVLVSASHNGEQSDYRERGGFGEACSTYGDMTLFGPKRD